MLLAAPPPPNTLLARCVLRAAQQQPNHSPVLSDGCQEAPQDAPGG
jgi:hypothetical protein